MHIFYFFSFRMLGMIRISLSYLYEVIFRIIPCAGEAITKILWKSMVILHTEILLRLYWAVVIGLRDCSSNFSSKCMARCEFSVSFWVDVWSHNGKALALIVSWSSDSDSISLISVYEIVCSDCEGVQMRAVKLIPGLRGLTYEQRLEKL